MGVFCRVVCAGVRTVWARPAPEKAIEAPTARESMVSGVWREQDAVPRHGKSHRRVSGHGLPSRYYLGLVTSCRARA